MYDQFVTNIKLFSKISKATDVCTVAMITRVPLLYGAAVAQLV
jgi:hypothetical protein